MGHFVVFTNSGRFAPVRQFELRACDSHKSNCATDAVFSEVYTSSIDAFPAIRRGPWLRT